MTGGKVDIITTLDPTTVPAIAPVFRDHDDFVRIRCAEHGLSLVTRQLWLDTGLVACSRRWQPHQGTEAHWTGGYRPGGRASYAAQSLAWTLPSPRRMNDIGELTP